MWRTALESAPIHTVPDNAASDPLLRMTLMDFSPDYETRHAAGRPAAEEAGGSADDLSRAIEDLQSKPWRGTRKPRPDEEEDFLDEFDSPEPEFVLRARRQQRFGRMLRMAMSVGSGFLLAALLAQGTYHFRDQIAARLPQTRLALEQLCGLIGCQVGLPAQIDSVSVESSELQALADSQNNFALATLLRNRSSVSQAWPNIELTLNDAEEKPVVRRVFTPREYLSKTQDSARGLPPNSEQPVRVVFTLSQLKATGYRVYLFYP
ncbi:MAG: hypothetical protein JWQ23_2473 [Herminiimonas sp.]|nr:hypothetical protein [Herminiimonas sp.]